MSCLDLQVSGLGRKEQTCSLTGRGMRYVLMWPVCLCREIALPMGPAAQEALF